MLDLLRVSSPFPRLTGALDVSPPRIGRKVIPAKASFGSPQTEEPVFTRVPYSFAFSRILVCPSVLSFLQTCLFFSRLCVCLCVWRLVQEMRKTRQLVRGEGWVSAALERPCWNRCFGSLVKHHPQRCKDEACVCVCVNTKCEQCTLLKSCNADEHKDRMKTAGVSILSYFLLVYIINDYLKLHDLPTFHCHFSSNVWMWSSSCIMLFIML